MCSSDLQVSRSKKWASKPLLDDAGKPVLQKNGKQVLKKSYSILQDDFFNYMRAAGYTDVERGERGSTEEHLTVTQFKVQREQERLGSLTVQIDQKEQHLTQTNKTLSKTEKELAAVGERFRDDEALRGAYGGAAWLSSARAVRCRLKCHNERNPCS